MNIFKSIIGVIFIAGTLWYSLYLLRPPEPKPAAAPARAFSAERAFEHVLEIGREPHPLGSEENAAVREYILNELQELGVEADVKEGLSMQHGIGMAAYVQNIFAKIPGTNPQKTILLMAHYDSVPNGRGAGDDGAGVAAILEVIRALQSQEPLKNNVWILFTDGEELGLLGAEFFIQNNNNWKQIDLVMNVEGRGSSGASIMFETSVNNAALIKHFAEATAYPVANSLSYTVYTLLPNSTDLSVMKEAGLTALNFAFIEDHLNYHTLQDNPENLSPATLQHHGSNLLSNVRYFGSRNFDLESSYDMVYFKNLAGGILYYPAYWSFPTALIVFILFAVLLIVEYKRKNLSAGKFLLGILSFTLITLLGAFLTYSGWALMESLHPAYRWLAQGEVYVHQWYLWGFSALMLAVSLAAYRWLHPKLKDFNLQAGIYTVWILLSLTSAWLLPTASYLFIWPVLFAASGIFIASNYFEVNSWPRFLIICISIFPALFIVFPYIPTIQTTMTTNMLWVSMLLLMLLIGLCRPLINLIVEPYTYRWSITFAALFLIAMIGASISSGFDAEHKKQNSLIYAVELSSEDAYWLSSDPEPDAWTSRFLGEGHQRIIPEKFNFFWRNRYLRAEAPFHPVKKAHVSLLADSVGDSLRYIRLQVQSQAEALKMRFGTDLKTGFVKVKIMGEVLYDRTQPFPGQRPKLSRFYYFGDLNETVEMTVAVPTAADSLAFNLQFISKDLFNSIIENYESRLPFMMPIPFKLSDAVVWKQRVEMNELQ